MKYYLDTEFIESGHEQPVKLISIGITAEDDRNFYAVPTDGWSYDECSPWLKENVIPYLYSLSSVKTLVATRKEIASELYKFVTQTSKTTEFWGWYCDYDWVLFCQLFGTMMDLPAEFPRYCNDVRQEVERLKLTKAQINLMRSKNVIKHHALADAWQLKDLHEKLIKTF